MGLAVFWVASEAARTLNSQSKKGLMNYTERQPSPTLSRYLEAFWFVYGGGEISSASDQTERVLPDGCIEWIFHLGDPFQRFVDGDWQVQRRSFVVGEMTKFILLQATGRTTTMGVRFRPGGAYRFLPAPLNLLTDQTVTTDELWGREGTFLEEAVVAAPTDLCRLELIESFLLKRLQATSPRLRFDAAVGEIMGSRGRTRVDQLADRIGWSPRQLEREFRASAGLSPKALARVIRFQSLLHLVGECRLRDWASMALESGYADQPHMVREFREYCGLSPTEQRTTHMGDLASNFVSPQRLTALLGEI
jgi:AraC-like DNA-binding protein